VSWLTDIWVLREIILPVLDVLLLAFLIYKGYQILVQTRAIQLVKGAMFMVLMYVVAFFLNLQTVLWLINQLAPFLVIGIAIIFQPELRKIFTRIGQGRLLQLSGGSKPYQLDAVIGAVEVLSYRKRGALIVFVRSVGQKNIIETGTRLDADLSSAILLTIFGHDTALHDGAVVLEEGKVAAAGCFLPLSEQLDVRRSFGTRHRAALGLVEESDAVVLVVSEETGALSLAYDGNLYYDLSVDDIRHRLSELLKLRERSEPSEEEVESLED
jgi:diadenylate cyclase